MVTWPMTSRDSERSRSWPHCVWCPLSRKRLEIPTWWQWTTYRKWPPGNQLVTWTMTSLDPGRSRSWPQYVWCPVAQKRLEIPTWWQWSILGNGYLGIKWGWPHDRWRHMTLKGQGRNPNILRAQFPKTAVQCESKKSPLRGLDIFFIFLTNGWEFLIDVYTPIMRSYLR